MLFCSLTHCIKNESNSFRCAIWQVTRLLSLQREIFFFWLSRWLKKSSLPLLFLYFVHKEITSNWGSLNQAGNRLVCRCTPCDDFSLLLFFFLNVTSVSKSMISYCINSHEQSKKWFQVQKRKTSQHLISFQTYSRVILFFYCYLKSIQCFFNDENWCWRQRWRKLKFIGETYIFWRILIIFVLELQKKN
jgi:hypothetical protein